MEGRVIHNKKGGKKRIEAKHRNRLDFSLEESTSREEMTTKREKENLNKEPE